MKDTSELINSLNLYFKWNKARMTCFVHLLLGLFAVRTVNLREIAVAFDSHVQIDSRYKRLKRFLAHFHLDLSCLGLWIFHLFFTQETPFYVILDRTNWFWGKKKINVLMLAIAYEGIAIPLFWMLLPKAGSSQFTEQKALLERLIKSVGTARIKGVLADREFGSGKLFNWLNQLAIPFYIRIKEGSQARIKGKKWRKVQSLFSTLTPKTASVFGMTVEVFGAQVFLAGSRSERGELMIVATNRCPKNAIAIYLRRWEIENLFQCLKSRGFSFEETHITALDRIEKLLGVLAIGVAWAHKVGEWRALLKPITMNRYGSLQRPQFTFFRYGFDFLRDALLHRYRSKIQFRQCIQQIILPLQPAEEYLL